jgi:hypothetical protein
MSEITPSDFLGAKVLLERKFLQLRINKSPVYAGLFVFKKKGIKMKRVLITSERLAFLCAALVEVEKSQIERAENFEILLKCSYEPVEPVFLKHHKEDNRKWYDFKRKKKNTPN